MAINPIVKGTQASPVNWGDSVDIINGNFTAQQTDIAAKVDKIAGSTLITAQQVSDLAAIKALVLTTDDPAKIDNITEILNVFANNTEGFDLAAELAKAVPNTRTVAGYPLTDDIILNPEDVNVLLATNTDVANNTILELDGDSLTDGINVRSYGGYLANLLGFQYSNNGVGGFTSTQIKDKFLSTPERWSRPHIIWAGRNNFEQPATVKADIATMYSTSGHNRNLVISVLNSDNADEYKNTTKFNIIQQLNADLSATYGLRYVDLYTYLLGHGLNDTNDNIDVANGVIPRSLRLDKIHLNSKGNRLAANFIATKAAVLYPTETLFVTIQGLIQTELQKRQVLQLGAGGSVTIGDERLLYAPAQEDPTNHNSIFVGNGGGNLQRDAGFGNTGVGFDVLKSATTAKDNTGLGDSALAGAITAMYLTAIGCHALEKNTAGQYNTAEGWGALYNSTGSFNTAHGARAGYALAAGNGSVFVGYNVFANVTAGNGHIGIGNNLNSPVDNVSNFQMSIGNAIYGNNIDGNGSTIATGNIGFFVKVPTARVQFPAGQAAAGKAPVKFTAGVNLTTPEDGALEYDGTKFYTTIGTVRDSIVNQTALDATNSQVTAISNLVQVRKGTFAGLTNVAFGARMPIANAVSDGVATTETSRQKYKAIGNISDLKLFFMNIPWVLTPLTDPGHSDITIEASIEYPVNVFTRVTFQNDTSNSYLLKKNKTVLTDFVPIAIPRDAIFWIRTNVLVTAGQKWLKNSAVSASGTAQEGVVTGQNLVMSGTIAATSANSFGPSIIAGVSDSPMPSILKLGDSVSKGTGDSGGTTYNGDDRSVGLYGRRFLDLYPTISGNIAGQKISDYDPAVNPIVNFYGQAFSGALYSVSNAGINDVRAAGATLAAIQASYIKVWGGQKARGIKVYQTTLTPDTNSTDSWVTTTNQTVKSYEPIRVGINNWLRDGAPLTQSTWTPAAVGATGADIIRMGSVNHPLAGYFETADIAETARNSGIWKANSTTDGLHPNATMYALLYLAIDLSVFK